MPHPSASKYPQLKPRGDRRPQFFAAGKFEGPDDLRAEDFLWRLGVSADDYRIRNCLQSPPGRDPLDLTDCIGPVAARAMRIA